MKMNSLVAYASGLALACASHGAVIEVIHTGIAGHPTAHVPGQAAGVEFRGPLAAFLTLYGSPTGNYWFLKAFSNEADAVNEVMILGSGNTSSTVAKEGSASPLAGLNYGFMDSDCGVNDSGAYTFGNRLSAGTTTDEILFKYDTGTSSIVSAVREGDVAPGLTDPSGAGNELFGNSLNSAHILNNGVVRFKADTIQNINTNFRSALYSGLTVLAQEGTPGPTGTYDSFVALSGNTISSDANGAHWIVEADLDPAIAGTLEAAIMDGAIVLKDGDALSGSTVTDIFAVDMAGNGDWFVRGALANGHDFALRNGTIIAETGNPVAATRGDLLWGDTLVLVNGDSLGNYVVAGNTNSGDPNSDQVMVVNGTSVVAQEGDVIDLDGDGQDNDNAFVTSFTTASTVLADSGEIIFVASIRDGAGTNLGNAILRIAPPTPACPGDFDGDNAVGLSDIAYVIQRWGQPGYGLAEIATIIQNWASTCP